MSDSDCLRFVRARKYDVSKAVLMAVKWSEWYYKVFDNNLLHPDGEPICPANSVDQPYAMENVRNAICPHSYLGRDKEGRPIYWEETGLISTRFAELSSYFTVDELTVQHVRMQELMRVRCEHASAEAGKCVDKVVCVMNLKGLSYRLDTEALRAFRINLQIDTDFYPERLKYLYMINAPWFFTSIWAMMRPLIDPITADKIKIVGKDYLNVLREHIDDDQIPPELGGSCPDFKWEYPFPDRSGISEAQLGYTSCTSGDNDSALHQLDEIRSRTSSLDEQKPRYVCLAAVVNARIVEVDRLKSHDEYIIRVEEVDENAQQPPTAARQAKHRYSDFDKLRSRLKRIISGEKKAQKAQKNRQPSVNQFVNLPQLPPKKLFSQSGSVLSSRILGLSSFLTTLLLSVKISNHSMYFPGSELNLRSQNGSVPNVIEDPVVQLIMQFLMVQSPAPLPDDDMISVASKQVTGDLNWSSKERQDQEDVADDFEFEDETDAGEGRQSIQKDGVVGVDKKAGAEEEEAGVDLQTRLRELAGGGIVSVAIFGLSVVGMYLQQ